MCFRFQMVEKWGYKLPEKPQEKSFRACYRASRRQCLMQDISFLQCIQIQGPEEFIIERLNRLTHPSTGKKPYFNLKFVIFFCGLLNFIPECIVVPGVPLTFNVQLHCILERLSFKNQKYRVYFKKHES